MIYRLAFLILTISGALEAKSCPPYRSSAWTWPHFARDGPGYGSVLSSWPTISIAASPALFPHRGGIRSVDRVFFCRKPRSRTASALPFEVETRKHWSLWRAGGTRHIPVSSAAPQRLDVVVVHLDEPSLPALPWNVPRQQYALSMLENASGNLLDIVESITLCSTLSDVLDCSSLTTTTLASGRFHQYFNAPCLFLP